MATATSPALVAMREDLKTEVEILRVKRCVLRIFERLPDDDARRRVMMAATVLLGHDELLGPIRSRVR